MRLSPRADHPSTGRRLQGLQPSVQKQRDEAIPELFPIVLLAASWGMLNVPGGTKHGRHAIGVAVVANQRTLMELSREPVRAFRGSP
jgi:hypothetical protein